MSKKVTELNILLDASGSMENLWDDAIGGIKALILEQQKNNDPATITLITFNSKQINTILDNQDLQTVNTKTLTFPTPDGGTPLLDALGHAITSAKTRFDDAVEKPLVFFYIISDGKENNSQVLTKAEVSTLIKDTQSRFDWNYVYSCADFASFQEATSYGIDPSQNLYKTVQAAKKAGSYDYSTTWVSSSTVAYSNFVSAKRAYNTDATTASSNIVTFADYADAYFKTENSNDSDKSE